MMATDKLNILMRIQLKELKKKKKESHKLHLFTQRPIFAVRNMFVQ